MIAKKMFPVFVPSSESVGADAIASVLSDRRGMIADHVIAATALTAGCEDENGQVEDAYRFGFILVSDGASMDRPSGYARDFKQMASPELMGRLMYAFHSTMADIFGERAMREALRAALELIVEEDGRNN